MIRNPVFFLLLLCCWTLSQPLTSQESDEWENFKKNFGKHYGTKEIEELRKQVFLENLKKINEHNQLYTQGIKSFDLKINKFGDLSTQEYRLLVNGYKKRAQSGARNVYEAPKNQQLPSSVDWRPLGAVTAIKDQGQCGSCWAFSATGSLEGQMFLKKGQAVSLSEQNLMDCSENYGNMGCEGGLMDQAFEYIKQNGGIDTEASYPYEAEDDRCRFKSSSIGATLKSYTDVTSRSESDLQSAVANIGPISVAIDAGQFSFQFYSSGIYYEEDCSQYDLDHGVLAVGYGSNSKGSYWIVKNSWGSSWGDAGYILMARNRNNNCGIATQASYPNV